MFWQPKKGRRRAVKSTGKCFTSCIFSAQFDSFTLQMQILSRKVLFSSCLFPRMRGRTSICTVMKSIGGYNAALFPFVNGTLPKIRNYYIIITWYNDFVWLLCSDFYLGSWASELFRLIVCLHSSRKNIQISTSSRLKCYMVVQNGVSYLLNWSFKK